MFSRITSSGCWSRPYKIKGECLLFPKAVVQDAAKSVKLRSAFGGEAAILETAVNTNAGSIENNTAAIQTNNDDIGEIAVFGVPLVKPTVSPLVFVCNVT